MYPSMKTELAARDGDLRLCLLLGIAAWFLFLDHVPHNVVSLLTMRNFGFSGATDLFAVLDAMLQKAVRASEVAIDAAIGEAEFLVDG